MSADAGLPMEALTHAAAKPFGRLPDYQFPRLRLDLPGGAPAASSAHRRPWSRNDWRTVVSPASAPRACRPTRPPKAPPAR